MKNMRLEKNLLSEVLLRDGVMESAFDHDCQHVACHDPHVRAVGFSV